MRKKLVVFSFIFLVLNICVAQQNWIIVNTKSDFPEEKIKEVIPIVDEENNNLALFFKTKKGLESYLYNEEQAPINRMSIDKLPSKSDILIGNSYNGLNHSLFFSNQSGSKLSLISLNFETNNFNIIEDLDFKTKGEHLIKYVSHKDKLYLLTLERYSSVLKLYTFSMDGSFKTSRFDLSNEVFENDNGLEYDLSTLLFHNNSYNHDIVFIPSNVPTTLEATSLNTKVYYNQEHLILTSNLYNKFTYKIDIDLSNEQYSLLKIENRHFLKEKHFSKSNSFVIDSFFLQVYTNKKKVFFDVFQENGLKHLKTFTINEFENIWFKNSPIIIQNGSVKNTREIEKTKRFIKKLSSSNIAVSAYEKDNSYIITLGSIETNNSLDMILIGAILGGAVGAIIFATFDAYVNTRSTRIECLFDKNFNHVEGDIPENGFDKINTFILNNKLKHLKHQTVFKFKDQYIWGSYNKTAGFYRLFSF